MLNYAKNFKKYIRLYKSLYLDERTPKASKVLLKLAIGYFFLHFDLIPDFIPGLGHLDDLIIVPSLVFMALRFIPEKLYREHYNKIFEKN